MPERLRPSITLTSDGALATAAQLAWNCLTHQPSAKMHKAEMARCHKRADRGTWAHFLDRVRFFSPEAVSSKPPDRAGFSCSTSLQSTLRNPLVYLEM